MLTQTQAPAVEEVQSPLQCLGTTALAESLALVLCPSSSTHTTLNVPLACPLARESPTALEKVYLTAAIALSTHGPTPLAGQSWRRVEEVDGTGYF